MGKLDWLPRDDEIKNHELYGEHYFGTEPPSVMYELKPVKNERGEPVEGLNTAWITLNNPQQFNSYTTEMVKGVIAGFSKASMDRSVVLAVFTAVGDKAFCTGGNTKEYAEYYSGRPAEYGAYMDLFNGMVDAILMCKKPVICRANGMRIAGGQEIGMACDLTLSSDLAMFGQAGPRHGSAPDGGSTDFLPWYLSIEQAMYNCVSCEMWSAYKMQRLGLITKAIPVLREGERWVRNPLVITDKYLEEGEIVYGEMKTGQAAKDAKEKMKALTLDFSPLDAELDALTWKFTNLFPGCLIKSIDGIRAKKKYFWDQAKIANRHWLAANMATEAHLGFNAFNSRKLTGADVIDFVKFRQLSAQGHAFDEEFMAAVLAKPKG
ncbi:MAG: 6-oxocyclohex-1-ene-1-carbonyl-CoA hydratase [Planctomycetota bacterium]